MPMKINIPDEKKRVVREWKAAYRRALNTVYRKKTSTSNLKFKDTREKILNFQVGSIDLFLENITTNKYLPETIERVLFTKRRY